MNTTLKNLFGKRAPTVVAVFADSEEKLRKVAPLLMEGESAEISQNGDNYQAVLKGADLKNATFMHMGNRAGVAYAVANLEKAFAPYDIQTEDFDEAVKNEGFMPGMMTAMNALHDTIMNAAMSDDTNTPEAFSGKVMKAVDAFSAYVESLINGLPEKAFKFEKALTAATPSTGPVALHFTPEGFSQEVHDAVFGGEAPNPSAQMQDTTVEPEGGTQAQPAGGKADPAPAAAPAGDKAASGGTPDAAGDTPDAGAGDTKAAADDPPKPDNLEELPEGAAGNAPTVDFDKALQAAMADLTKGIGTQIAEAMKPLADRLDTQDAAVAKLSKAMGTSVAGTPEQDTNVVPLTKGEQAPSYGSEGPPLLDTAYNVNKG